MKETYEHKPGEAGHPQPLDDAGCAASEPYALRVMGDSMAPEFPDGSVIVIEPGGAFESGSFVIAQAGGEYIFRQFIIENGQHLLKPLNPGYESIAIAGAGAIKGVVVQRAGARRRHRKHYAGGRG